MARFTRERQGPSASEIFARRLRETRLARGLSQAELARQMQERGVAMSKVAVLRIERGERGLSLDEALAFARVLGASPAHLLSPPDGEHVWLIETEGLTGGELRNWLLFGDPFLVSEEGQRVRARYKAIFAIEGLAQAIVDAKRGDDRAGVEAAFRQLVEVTQTHRDELEAIDQGEEEEQ